MPPLSIEHIMSEFQHHKVFKITEKIDDLMLLAIIEYNKTICLVSNKKKTCEVINSASTELRNEIKAKIKKLCLASHAIAKYIRTIRTGIIGNKR